jgi:type II secretory ATPase GspE/PulE/Tfp pilus assembly ATPase PilB-like protein
VQVNTRAGLSFASGLRAMMRADPDIIMVGEIRDRETAQIAIEGALTGHLVLSTLHTNDAPGAISRLIEMGIEPFLVASALDCIVAQRLARTLCQHLQAPHDPVGGGHARPRLPVRLADRRGLTSRSAARAAAARVRWPQPALRGPDVTRRSAPRDRARVGGSIAEVAVRRACAACARTAGEGQAGPDLDRRGLP